MAISILIENILSIFENKMREAIMLSKFPATNPNQAAPLLPLHHMLAYHLGLEGDGTGSTTQGKRVRPLLLLLTAASAGAEWHRALPAAISVELLHNFSLIHDDIEDNSPLRRGRPTLWKKWGIPQAINTGDALYSLANLAILEMAQYVSSDKFLDILKIYHTTCLHLTQGQYLDISFETAPSTNIEEYFTMIGGKTAALLFACTGIGAITANVENTTLSAYLEFGQKLGLAFQVQDDLLGIWGDAKSTGKSAESDLVEGKKTLPVLFGLEKNGGFARRWVHGPIAPSEVEEISNQLEIEGAKEFTQKTADRLTTEALSALERANPQGEAGEALVNLAHTLLRRKS